MITDGKSLPLISSDRITGYAAWLRAFMASQGVALAPASSMDRCLRNMEYTGLSLGGLRTARRPYVNYFFHNSVLGLAFYIGALKRALERVPVGTFKGHLRVFHGPNIVTYAGARRTKAGDRAWELLVGCLVGSFAENIRMTNGGDTDVACTYHAQDLGVECKVLHSPQVDEWRQDIIDGAKQLEGSNAGLGVVAANATCAVAPQAFQRWPLRPFATPAEAKAALDRELIDMVSRVDTQLFRQHLTSDIRVGLPRMKARKVAFFAQVVAGIGTPPVPTHLTSVRVLDFQRIAVPPCDDFMNAFSQSTQL
jgi:hypothetical protein